MEIRAIRHGLTVVERWHFREVRAGRLLSQDVWMGWSWLWNRSGSSWHTELGAVRLFVHRVDGGVDGGVGVGVGGEQRAVAVLILIQQQLEQHLEVADLASISASARAIQSFLQVRNFISGEKIYFISLLAYLADKGDS